MNGTVEHLQRHRHRRRSSNSQCSKRSTRCTQRCYEWAKNYSKFSKKERVPKQLLVFYRLSRLRICQRKKIFCLRLDQNNRRWESTWSSWSHLTYCSRRNSAGQLNLILTIECVMKLDFEITLSIQ